jgi:hypothetical protein
MCVFRMAICFGVPSEPKYSSRFKGENCCACNKPSPSGGRCTPCRRAFSNARLSRPGFFAGSNIWRPASDPSTISGCARSILFLTRSDQSLMSDSITRIQSSCCPIGLLQVLLDLELPSSADFSAFLIFFFPAGKTREHIMICGTREQYIFDNLRTGDYKHRRDFLGSQIVLNTHE